MAVAQEQRAQVAIDSVAIRRFGRFKVLIVPRHPQRFDEVAALVAQHGLRLSRRSQWQGSPADSMEAMNADVWLGDSLGEMALLGDSAARAQAVVAGLAFAARHRGATSKTLEALRTYL